MTMKPIISPSRAYAESVITCMTSSSPSRRHWEATLLYAPAQAVLFVCVCVCLLPDQRCNQRPAHTPLSRSCSSLFPPQETQITQFVLRLNVLRRPACQQIFMEFSARAFTVSLSRDAGRLTALMAIKISGRMLTLEKATGNGRGWKREFTT